MADPGRRRGHGQDRDHQGQTHDREPRPPAPGQRKRGREPRLLCGHMARRSPKGRRVRLGPQRRLFHVERADDCSARIAQRGYRGGIARGDPATVQRHACRPRQAAHRDVGLDPDRHADQRPFAEPRRPVEIDKGVQRLVGLCQRGDCATEPLGSDGGAAKAVDRFGSGVSQR